MAEQSESAPIYTEVFKLGAPEGNLSDAGPIPLASEHTQLPVHLALTDPQVRDRVLKIDNAYAETVEGIAAHLLFRAGENYPDVPYASHEFRDSQFGELMVSVSEKLMTEPLARLRAGRLQRFTVQAVSLERAAAYCPELLSARYSEEPILPDLAGYVLAQAEVRSGRLKDTVVYLARVAVIGNVKPRLGRLYIANHAVFPGQAVPLNPPLESAKLRSEDKDGSGLKGGHISSTRISNRWPRV